MLIVGEKEAAEGRVAVRIHGKGDQGSLDLNEFVEEFRTSTKAPA
jgi:threonyl-tRNA synthetase